MSDYFEFICVCGHEYFSHERGGRSCDLCNCTCFVGSRRYVRSLSERKKLIHRHSRNAEKKRKNI